MTYKDKLIREGGKKRTVFLKFKFKAQILF